MVNAQCCEIIDEQLIILSYRFESCPDYKEYKMKRLIIEMSDEQSKKLKEHLENQNKINSEEETFSGFAIILVGMEFGLTWLEVETDTKESIGDVNWKIE